MSDKRSFSQDMNDLIGVSQPVLGRGSVTLLDYMGTDSDIAQAARTSYEKGTKTVNDDKGLINYLMAHNHTTPFEMCEMKLLVKTPMFVARQWLRHRTPNVNEVSARYSILPNDFYIPEREHILQQSKMNNQGGDGESPNGQKFRVSLDLDSQFAYRLYEEYIESGMARETARMMLPVNIYTKFVWKVDLHNLLHFLRLRADPHAQYEIRVYAELILDMVKKWVPFAYDAFKEYRMEAVGFSKTQAEMIQAHARGRLLVRSEWPISNRDWEKVMTFLDVGKK